MTKEISPQVYKKLKISLRKKKKITATSENLKTIKGVGEIIIYKNRKQKW